MRFGSTAKVLAKCKLKYYRMSLQIIDHGPCSVILTRTAYNGASILEHHHGRHGAALAILAPLNIRLPLHCHLQGIQKPQQVIAVEEDHLALVTWL